MYKILQRCCNSGFSCNSTPFLIFLNDFHLPILFSIAHSFFILFVLDIHDKSTQTCIEIAKLLQLNFWKGQRESIWCIYSRIDNKYVPLQKNHNLSFHFSFTNQFTACQFDLWHLIRYSTVLWPGVVPKSVSTRIISLWNIWEF